MIVFVTAYDAATEANHAVAREIVRDGELFLGAESASKTGLLLALQRHDGPLFVMTHGNEDRLLAQGGDPLTTADLGAARLASRPVFAHACRAARRFGRAVAHEGSVFWGYMVEVTPPEDAPALLPVFAEVFSFIKSSFPTTQSEEAQERFFKELFERCDSAQARLSELHEAGEVHVPLTAEYCLFQIQQDLVVWSPGKERARQPPWARGRRLVEM